MNDYRLLADAIADDIAAGRLRPGDRLPAQREFAYQRRIAASTAGRVYAELTRRGLTVGEVGRGTFVATRSAAMPSSFTEATELRVDLAHMFPILPDQEVAIARSLGPMLRPEAVAGVLQLMPAAGTPAGRSIAARFLRRPGWTPAADRLCFAGNGKQALAAAVAALVPPGARLGVEPLTYPTVKGLAERHGVTLVPIGMDAAGMRPDLLCAAHRSTPLAALYLQPVLHNPLGITLPPARRAALAGAIADLDLLVIEDGINSFLSDAPPLAALLPERCVMVDSLSKRIAPGLTIGIVVPPPALVDRLVQAIRDGALQAPALTFEAVSRLMQDGTAAAIVAAKRQDAAARQAVVRGALAGFAVHADPRAYHLWLELPKPWRSHQLVAAAARKGIALTPSSAFAVRDGHAPNAIRITLAQPPLAELRSALDVLAGLLRRAPEEVAPFG